jgi:hypothetical protein
MLIFRRTARLRGRSKSIPQGATQHTKTDGLGEAPADLGAERMSDPNFLLPPIGIPWCREENYDAFVSIFEDRKNLPPLWQRFVKTAEEIEEFYKAKGHPTFRVNIDPRAFPRWCESKGHRINVRARAQFAYEVANAKSDND